MNVLFNTYPIAFDVPGGGEIQLIKTRAAIRKRGHLVELYDQWVPKIRQANLVHYFSVFGGSSIFCNYVKDLKKPLAISPILYPHENINQYPIEEIRHLLNTADILFPNSEAEAELLAQTFGTPKSKFHVVHNGVDDIFTQKPDFGGELFRDHFKFSDPFLLTVANIENRKNQISLAKALSKTNYNLVLFGNIRNQSYFDEMMKVSNGRIHYLGYLPNDSKLLRSAYLACDAFVLPSFLETPGLAALEAGAMGAKLAVTQIGSTREYFRDLVSYIDPKNETSILTAIEEARERRSDSSLSSHIKSQFTWENTALQTEAGYKKIY